MKAILLLFLLAIPPFNRANADMDNEAASKLIMSDAFNGWRQEITRKRAAILHTSDGGKHWTDVSPPALTAAAKKLIADKMDDFIEEMVAVCPLDAQRCWIAITTEGVVLLEYTADAGRHWKERIAPIETDAAHISFIDDRRGFLLANSFPAFGHMDKKVYGTEDGGERWYVLFPPPASGCYTNGIVFRSAMDGWITATYHGGDDAPLYHTHDGGRSWQLQRFPIPEDYKGGYADTFPPVFVGKDKMQGYLPVKLVRHEPAPDHYAWVNYETDDGGKTWHLPVSGVQSLSSD